MIKKRPRASRSRRIRNIRARRQSVPVWERTPQQLTPKLRRIREKSLEALSLVRRDKLTLQEASHRVGLDPQTIINSTNAFRKVHGRLKAKAFDKITRIMKIYEKGKLSHVEVANSNVASDIGLYWNAIAELTETGRSRALRSLHRRRFRDSTGCYHTLEKDPKIILELEARKPKRETFEIYKR